MKGCMVLQRQFALTANAIAVELKNNYGVEEFCGYVLSRRAANFINAQKDIQYMELLLDEDLHDQYKDEKLDIGYIKELEAEYGAPNLWQCIAIDRTIMMNHPPEDYSISPTPPYTHEEMQRILQVYFRNIIRFLKKEKPDFIVGVAVSCLGNTALYYVAKKMGIKTYTIETGKIGNRVTFSNDLKSLSGVDEVLKDIRNNKYQSPHKQEAADFLAEFRKNPAPPSFAVEEKAKGMSEKILLAPLKFFRALKFTLKSTYRYLSDPHKSDYTVENPAYALLNKFKRKARGMRNLNRFYGKPDWKEDFAYFPLQFEPEITTLLYAPFYTNQINLISQIAKSLPVHFKLYVKEHPSMLEYRPTEYYRELKKIPNVKLINPSVNSFALIENAKLVTTITGTAGWEAALLKKPVITFGDIFYNNLSFVKKCLEIEDLPNLIHRQLKNYEYDEKEAIDFLSAIFEDTLSFDFFDLWSKGATYEQIKNHPDFPKFVRNLTDKIGLKTKNDRATSA